MKKKVTKKNISKYIPLIIVGVALIVLGIVCPIFFSNDSYLLHRRIIDEFDDTRTFETSNEQGSGNEPDSWANLQVTSSYSFGIRFNNITIPKGSKIINAYVKLFSIGIPGHNHIDCIIYGDSDTNAINFSTKGCLKRSGRNYTESYVIWDAKSPYQKWVKTPILTEIVKEIINKPGWENGKSIVFLFITQHTMNSAVFSNFGRGNPSELYIYWN